MPCAICLGGTGKNSKTSQSICIARMHGCKKVGGAVYPHHRQPPQQQQAATTCVILKRAILARSSVLVTDHQHRTPLIFLLLSTCKHNDTASPRLAPPRCRLAALETLTLPVVSTSENGMNVYLETTAGPTNKKATSIRSRQARCVYQIATLGGRRHVLPPPPSVLAVFFLCRSSERPGNISLMSTWIMYI